MRGHGPCAIHPEVGECHLFQEPPEAADDTGIGDGSANPDEDDDGDAGSTVYSQKINLVIGGMSCSPFSQRRSGRHTTSRPENHEQFATTELMLRALEKYDVDGGLLEEVGGWFNASRGSGETESKGATFCRQLEGLGYHCCPLELDNKVFIDMARTRFLDSESSIFVRQSVCSSSKGCGAPCLALGPATVTCRCSVYKCRWLWAPICIHF